MLLQYVCTKEAVEELQPTPRVVCGYGLPSDHAHDRAMTSCSVFLTLPATRFFAVACCSLTLPGRRWTAERRHPTGRERTGSATLQTIQDPIQDPCCCCWQTQTLTLSSAPHRILLMLFALLSTVVGTYAIVVRSSTNPC